MISSLTALKQLLVFALPIIVGHLGIVLVGTGDMMIAGRYSSECLAAIGLAVAVANPIMISLLGLQFSLSPLLAQKRGRGESTEKYFMSVAESISLGSKEKINIEKLIIQNLYTLV